MPTEEEMVEYRKVTGLARRKLPYNIQLALTREEMSKNYRHNMKTKRFGRGVKR